MSNTTRPVTQEAEAEVKRASVKLGDIWSRLAIGKDKSNVPMEISIKYPSATIWGYVNDFNLLMHSLTIAPLVLAILLGKASVL